MSSPPDRPPQSLRKELDPFFASTSTPQARVDPDSPSTLLLRELQGDDDESPIKSGRVLDSHSPASRPTLDAVQGGQDDDEPPQSIMFGEHDPRDRPRKSADGERTPRSPSARLPPTQPMVFPVSPGPFRADTTSSISTDDEPGPSSIASDPRPPPPRRTSSKKSNQRTRTPPRLVSGTAYLDPSIPSPRTAKGKERLKTKAGREYASLPSREEDEDEDGEDPPGRGRYAGFGVVDGPGLKKSGLSGYEKALWRWVNVDDLDGFLQEVYEYYKGKGIYCIALARVLNLLTTFFVIAFSTFLLSCIDYSKLGSMTSGPNDIAHLDDVLIGQCLTRGSVPHMVFIISVLSFYIFQLVSFALSIPRLLDMYRFYKYLLGVPDTDIQTLPWPEIVRLIGEIRNHNPVTSLSNTRPNGQPHSGARALAEMVPEATAQFKKLDAHDIANRILRQENYLIALFNKELLDLRVRVPIPSSLQPYIPSSVLLSIERTLPTAEASSSPRYLTLGTNTLTKALEWNLRFCLMGYLFNRRGEVSREFVRGGRRKDLVQGLQTRLVFMALLNAVFAPFIVIYLLIYSFFRYFEEYHKNPSSIGSRTYTPYAQWKFREFNELPHLFERRLDRSYKVAKEYIDQFPKESIALLMRFVAFVAGAFAAVLLSASLLDPDLFLHFEITPHRTVLFYLGIFGSILAIARGMVPEENLVFDPEASLREVARWTHYLPDKWLGQLHSQAVQKDFSALFALKINVFFTELISVLLTPLILLFSLPPCAGAIIDFVREFTIHVDGLGYVCSFAVFDFGNRDLHPPSEIGPNGTPVTATPVRGRRRIERRANENKMEKSFLHFKATHPDWQPDPASSVFLDRLTSLAAEPQYGGGRGLGVGALGYPFMADSTRLEAKAKTYERAWSRSQMIQGQGGHALPTMKEGEDSIGQGEAEAMGWDRRIEEDEDEGSSEDEDVGLLRDAGMMGLLQEVLQRS